MNVGCKPYQPGAVHGRMLQLSVNINVKDENQTDVIFKISALPRVLHNTATFLPLLLIRNPTSDCSNYAE